MVKNAKTMLNKIEFFISDCEDFVSGKRAGSIDEAELLDVTFFFFSI